MSLQQERTQRTDLTYGYSIIHKVNFKSNANNFLPDVLGDYFLTYRIYKEK